MIKFFRKIRQNLLSENKFSKYLIYAVGEIILVVIGILIALQINNWNEKKNNINQAEKHLETISLNLKDDIIQAEKLLSETQTTIEYANDFLDQFKTLKPVDNNIQMYLIYLMFERNIEINESGLEALLNSNSMSFIHENLQSKILNYYRYIEQLKSRELNANTEIKTMYEPYVKENFYWIWNKTNPWHRQSEFYKDDPRTSENIDLKSVITDKKLEINVMNRRYQSMLIVDFYSNAIKLAKEIISEIEK
ncbi:hypothetical protein SAMN04487989_103280 [Bizionia echini]|uniref:Uncharacterized protein n=1 Tax=Bizionia echini TaxID=649333 RepID=A0A1I5BPW1_9FLAO|nr:DUF6090 family protein [Bizionia echini]SFN76677.1 hypothetical protein SAMN04487989_103280 [Bizionia echini]